ncbi:MAG: hypothetical protein ACK417_07660 [Bacteroidia bacterium]
MRSFVAFMLVVLGCSLETVAQTFSLYVRDCGEVEYRVVRPYADSLSATRALDRMRTDLQSRGYLTAAFDTLRYLENGLEVCVHYGQQYRWTQLNTSGIPADYLANTGFRYRDFENQPLNITELDQLIAALLRQAENEGFPFAQFFFDSLMVTDASVLAYARLEKGKLVVYDSLRLGGDLKLHPRVLARYLQLREGQYYRELDIQRINRRINALPYASVSESPQIFFYNDKASIAILADNRRVNSFDGMLGVFPGAGVDESLLITGDLNLLLWSAFSRGELISFNWRSLQQGTQDLKTRLRWPFLFGSPIGIDADFRLFRRDSSFLEVQTMAGLEYTFSPGNYAKGFYQQRSYRLLGSPLATGLSQARVDGSLYGLEYSLQRLDRAFNPYRGWRMVLGAAAGRRTANEQLSDGDFSGARNYDQYQFHTEGQVLVPWLVRWQTVLDWHGRALLSRNLYFNELFRFGGFKTLKGFDEESIFASSYLVANLEQRFLLDRDSWLYLFWNGGWLRNDAVGQGYSDFPYGFGGGITFQAGSGVFSVAYALGNERNQPLTTRNTKVHLGYRYLL